MKQPRAGVLTEFYKEAAETGKSVPFLLPGAQPHPAAPQWHYPHHIAALQTDWVHKTVLAAFWVFFWSGIKAKALAKVWHYDGNGECGNHLYDGKGESMITKEISPPVSEMKVTQTGS